MIRVSCFYIKCVIDEILNISFWNTLEKGRHCWLWPSFNYQSPIIFSKFVCFSKWINFSQENLIIISQLTQTLYFLNLLQNGFVFKPLHTSLTLSAPKAILSFLQTMQIQMSQLVTSCLTWNLHCLAVSYKNIPKIL